MLQQRAFSFFGTSFTLYVFERAGDELPLHQHSFEHGSVVASGRVLVFDGAGTELPIAAPHALVFTAQKRHGIRALSDGAAVLNVMPSVTP
jgi:quercetin dioxygenase-like cupin family protein